MTWTIESIDLFIRETSDPRFDFGIGKQGGAGQTLFPPFARGMLEVRLQLGKAGADPVFGTAGDWPSFGWLDKRAGKEPKEKLGDLLSLVSAASSVYLENPNFSCVFDKWHASYGGVIEAGRSAGQVDLSSAFASALFERALIDAVCRMEGKTFFEMVKCGDLGMRPDVVHPELSGFDYGAAIEDKPRTRFHLRHTVGFLDPLTNAEVDPAKRRNDGEPETLEDYIRKDGVSHLKLKISGDPERDLERLKGIWEASCTSIADPVITLDGNEAYEDLEAFDGFVDSLATDLPEMFARIRCIEQPLPRALTLDPDTAPAIEKIARRKPLMIDEADALIGTFREAMAIGYSGVSHKNCKGVFKSLMNDAFCRFQKESKGEDDSPFFLSGEDLTNLPTAALQQDYATLGVLGLEDCERNGHHYFLGLSHLSESERSEALQHHGDLYEERGGGNAFLKIVEGQVECASVHASPGFGVSSEPEWDRLEGMETWKARMLQA